MCRQWAAQWSRRPRREYGAEEVAAAGAPFVAREAELAFLHSQLTSALAGHGRVAFVRGEAGSGKTMLLAEFARQALDRDSAVVIVAGGCSALGGQGDTCEPFREVICALTASFEYGMDHGVLGEVHRQRLWATFPSALAALVNLAPDLLGAWMPVEPLVLRTHTISGLDPRFREQLETLRRRRPAGGQGPWTDRPRDGTEVSSPSSLPRASNGAIFEQVCRVLFAVASERPLVLLLDNLHWANPYTCGLLFHLGCRLAGTRVLVVGAFRGEDLILGDGRHPLQPVLRELQAQYGDNLLDLADADHQTFVNAYLNREVNRLDGDFRGTLLRFTEGHALFTVELLHNLQEASGLVRDEDGQWVVTAELDRTTVPPRVEAVIGERIERLPLACRQLLSVASVQGDVFCAEAVAEVLGEDILTVIGNLSDLLGRQHHLVEFHGDRLVGVRRLSRYRFRHHLFRLYVYQALDHTTQARLHHSTAEVLQSWRRTQSAPECVRETSGARLAWHFEQAGMAREAIPYLIDAGQEAYRLSASEQAIAYLNRGLELLKQLPEARERDEVEYALHAGLGRPLFTTYGYAAEQLTHMRAVELAQRLGKPDFLVPAMYLQFTHCLVRGEYEEATEITTHVHHLAEETQVPTYQLQASFQAGMVCLLTGRLQEARSHADIVLGLLDELPQDHTELHSGNIGRLSAANLFATLLWHQGYSSQALAYAKGAVASGEKLGHAYWLALAQTVSHCHILLLRREPCRLQTVADAALDIAEDRSFPIIAMLAGIYRSCALIEMGDSDGVVEKLTNQLTEYRASGHRFYVTLYLTYLAKACCKAGRVTQGLDVIGEAMGLVNKGDRLYESELHKVQGDLLVAAEDIDQAELAYRRAIQVSGEQEAYGLQLRATVSLARLCHDHGHRLQAYHLLTQVYGRFTEGFETADLREARVLLDKLRIAQ